MIRIIAVDDDPAFTEILEIYLKEMGDFDIKTYNSPQKSIEEIINQVPDTVIVDYRMDELDGISLIRQVKEKLPNLPSIMLTGDSDKNVIPVAIEAGIDFIQYKAEDPSRLFLEIAQKIINIVERHRAQEEKEKSLKAREKMMTALHEIIERLSLVNTQIEAADVTLSTINSITGGTIGAVYIVNPGNGRLEFLVGQNLPEDYHKNRLDDRIQQTISTGKVSYYSSSGEKIESNIEDLLETGFIPLSIPEKLSGVVFIKLEEPIILTLELKDTIEIAAGHLANALVKIRSQEEVIKQQKELSEFYSVMNELVVVIDMDGTIRGINPATIRTLGYTEKELVGMPIHTIYQPEMKDEIIFQFLMMNETGNPIKNTMPMLAKNGTLIQMETKGSIGVWGGRNVLFCIARDNTERIEAERNLHEYLERIQAILAASTASIYLKNRDLKYQLVNDVFGSFVDKNTEEIVGKTDWDIYDKNHAKSNFLSDAEVLRLDKPIYNIEEKITTINGNERWFTTSKVPLHDQDKKVAGLVGTSLDITDLAKTRDDLIIRDKISTAVNLIAEILVTEENMDNAFNPCLYILGRAADMDQVFLAGTIGKSKGNNWQFKYDWKHEHCVGSDLSKDDTILEELTAIIENTTNNDYYLLSGEEINELLKLESNNKKPESILLFPIFLSNTLWGIIVFIRWDNKNKIQKSIIESLNMAAKLITSSINRHQTEELYRKPIEKSLAGVFIVQDEKFAYTNPRMSEILGYSCNELHEMTIINFIHQEDKELVNSNYFKTIEDQSHVGDIEVKVVTASNNTINIEILTSGFIYLGKPAMIGSVIDITARKKAEVEVLKSLKEKDILLREIHHRVKNNMQVVVSLLRMQLVNVTDPQAYAILRESKNRILSMAMIHEKMYRTDNLTSINMLEYITSLTGTLVTDFSPDEKLIDLNIVCDPSLEMTIDAGIPTGLILNELVSNSFKHGIPPGKKGTINISVLPNNKESIDIIYRDSGVGLPEGFNPEMCDSLGMQIIMSLTMQLSGEINFASDNGILVTIKIPFQDGFIVGDK